MISLNFLYLINRVRLKLLGTQHYRLYRQNQFYSAPKKIKKKLFPPIRNSKFFVRINKFIVDRITNKQYVLFGTWREEVMYAVCYTYTLPNHFSLLSDLKTYFFFEIELYILRKICLLFLNEATFSCRIAENIRLGLSKFIFVLLSRAYVVHYTVIHELYCSMTALIGLY